MLDVDIDEGRINYFLCNNEVSYFVLLTNIFIKSTAIFSLSGNTHYPTPTINSHMLYTNVSSTVNKLHAERSLNR